MLFRKPSTDHSPVLLQHLVTLRHKAATGACAALLPLMVSCGNSASTATCATTQSVTSYTNTREVEAESQHASFGGYLEYGKNRCTAYLEYTASEPVRARLWTAAHCYHPGLLEKPSLALYDRGRFVDVPLRFVEADAARAAEA